MKSTNQGKKIAEVLAEFVVSQKYEDLPKETVEKAKHSLVDCTGCILGASREQQAKILIEVNEGGRWYATEFGVRTRFQDFRHECCIAQWYHGTHP